MNEEIRNVKSLHDELLKCYDIFQYDEEDTFGLSYVCKHKTNDEEVLFIETDNIDLIDLALLEHSHLSEHSYLFNVMGEYEPNDHLLNYNFINSDGSTNNTAKLLIYYFLDRIEYSRNAKTILDNVGHEITKIFPDHKVIREKFIVQRYEEDINFYLFDIKSFLRSNNIGLNSFMHTFEILKENKILFEHSDKKSIDELYVAISFKRINYLFSNLLKEPLSIDGFQRSGDYIVLRNSVKENAENRKEE